MKLLRTRALAALFATSALTVAATAQDRPAAPTAQPEAARPAAPSEAEIGRWGFDATGMDRTVEPGDNMYQYANGTWAKATAIPADKSNYGMFTRLADLSDERTRTLIEEAGKQPGNKVGDLYASFMDRAAVEAAGHKPIQPMLAAIDGARDKTELLRVAGKLARQGVTTYLFGFVGADDKAPKTNIYQFYQGGIGLPDRDYYLSTDAGLAAKRAAYQAYAADLFGLAGERNGAARAAALVDFETRIAQAQWTQTDSRDATKTYNIWTRADFDAKAPGIDWTAYLGAVDADTIPRFRIYQPSAVTGAAKAFADTPLAVLKDQLKFQTIDAFAPFLSNAFVARNFAFRGTTLNGTPQNQVEWKRGVNLVTGAMGEDVGKAYVERYYPPEAEAAMNDLIKNILGAMGQRIQNLSWMSAPTKQRAAAKLAAFTPRIGHPKTFRDYSALQISRTDLIGNVVRANEFEYNRNLAKLPKPVDMDEWQMLPMTVNASANFELNAITFPAAILQPPFFDPKADPAINYGGIGAVIGHEISHHFDDQGSKYDETGALKEWWTAEDVKKFNALTDQLVAQFDKYEIFPGKFVNGRFTLGDNVGDLAGLAVAYDAYKASLGGKEAPVIDGLTGDQRFYLGWAQVWRRNYREDNLRNRLLTDPHAPSEQRVAIMRNLDPWYAAFKVKADDTLFLTPEQRVRIW